MAREADVVIVGAGLSGLIAARDVLNTRSADDVLAFARARRARGAR